MKRERTPDVSRCVRICVRTEPRTSFHHLRGAVRPAGDPALTLTRGRATRRGRLARCGGAYEARRPESPERLRVRVVEPVRGPVLDEPQVHPRRPAGRVLAAARRPTAPGSGSRRTHQG